MHAGAELLLEVAQADEVLRSYGLRGLHLDADHTSAVILEDRIDFMTITIVIVVQSRRCFRPGELPVILDLRPSCFRSADHRT